MGFSFDGTIDIVSSYAAILSTILFLREVYKWFWSFKLSGQASANMIIIGGIYKDESKYVTLSVQNIGDKKTTITNVCVASYSSRYHRFIRKASNAGLVNHSEEGYTLPYALEPGAEFRSKMIQCEKVKEWSRNADLYWAIYHTLSKKPFLISIPPISSK